MGDKFETAIELLRQTKVERLDALNKDKAGIVFQLGVVQSEIDVTQAAIDDLDAGLVNYLKGKAK